MAKKQSPGDEPGVVRIKAGKASSSKSSSTSNAKLSPKKPAATAPSVEPIERRRNPLKAFGGYFTGAWRELRQVHWPTRRATWSLTVAVIAFTTALMLIILLLDLLFNYGSSILLGT